MLSQSEIIKRAIERVADAEIEKKTAPCFRTYKAIITEAPNGTTCKVRLSGDDTELTLPYASKLSELTVGKYVWVGAFYNVDNSFSNAIVWETLKMDVGGGGGGSVTVDDALSTTSTNPVQNKVITNTINALPHDGIYYLENNGSVAAVTAKPYYAARWITTNDNLNVSAYYDGLTIAIRVPVAGNATYGTVLSVNGLGEHPVVRGTSTMIGTTYGVGSMLLLTYDANASANAYINSNSAISITGVWKLSDYDSINVYRLLQNYTTPAVNINAGILYRYELCFTKKDGTLIPANNVSNKTSTYTKVLNDEPFDPFGNIYYYYSTDPIDPTSEDNTVASGTLYRMYLADARYSFNINSSGTAGTTALTSHNPVFIKALYNKTTQMATLTQDLTSSNYLVRSGLVQELPSTDPNTGLPANQMYIYIYLGHAYNKYQIDLACLHQIYAWDSNSQSATIFFGESGTSGGTTDPNAFHKTDIIPIANGGTGIDGGSVETWYYNHNLHPHFAIFYDPLNVSFTVFWMGPLDGISSVSDFLASDYFKYAQKITHPMYLFSTSGSYLGSAMLFTGAFDSTMDTTKIYLLFPDAVSFNGTYVNGLGGNLVYDSSDGIYMNPATMTPSIPKWVNELLQLSGRVDGKQDVSDLVTSVDSSSTDDEYPSAKLLYDTEQILRGLIQDVDEEAEKTANKVTSISSSSTNTQYPSAKAVYDLFNSIVDADNVSF